MEIWKTMSRFVQNINMRKAKIKRIAKGKKKGEFRFVLYAINGEVIANSHPESYTQKHSCIATLKNNFPNFEIEDTTK